MREASAGYIRSGASNSSLKGGIRIQDSEVQLRAYKGGTMKDTSRNFTSCVVTLLIIGSVLFSAVESVRVSTKRVKGEYRRKCLQRAMFAAPHGIGNI